VPVLLGRTGRAPAPYLEWTNQLASRDTEELRPLLDDLEKLKAEGLTGGTVAIISSRRLIQPIQDRVHPSFEYWGQSDPTRVVRRKVSKEEIIPRVKNIFGGHVHNREYPMALGVYRLSDAVSLRPWHSSSIDLKLLLYRSLYLLCLFSCFQHREGIY
jgi:hypothetical protein